MKTLKFVLIAVVMMVAVDQFVFGGKRSYIGDAKVASREMREAEAKRVVQKPPPVRVKPENGAAYFEAPPSEGAADDVAVLPKVETDVVVASPSPKPSEGGRGRSVARVAIIIDDLGMDVRHSKQVIDLPAPVTLAFLPYAPQVKTLAAGGKAKGHELIIHVPMAAMDGDMNIGPGGLKAGMDTFALQEAFGVMLNSFDGYVGINNHMGSRLTQDPAAMDALMPMLKTRGLFFVDSRTAGASVIASRAVEAGVPYAERDVFLDHVDSAAFVAGALAKTEKRALSHGSAIAIGHPKTHTIAALKAWIPTLKAKGIEIVPVSELLVGGAGVKK